MVRVQEEEQNNQPLTNLNVGGFFYLTMYYIYILYSETHDRYYVGYTSDVFRRLEEHNTNSRMTYTHKFGPWKLKTYFEVGENRAAAMKIEKYIKKQKSRKLIERLINEPGLFGQIAQLV